ncbi:hypothetical protein DER29_4008 [Micromonospora sp. M71_S20]|uniref:hypothetical protein n=1 Tax=Micromonospora sp. M71_S20 TaxID=592872 RepID=UPI000F161372|nr:hypothetical protein [Micromonospora sp. M71_S20]RLK25990.1 hypothetical protein DER29_4008 [Micromonospora sp. M71_S20]
MFFRRTERPADRGASDRLLDAARTPDTEGSEPLARLLSAAAAPARPGELAGEEDAVAAFRAARAAGPAAGGVPSPRRRRFTAGAVAWGAGIAVTATAGAAFAAVTLDRADDPPPPPRPATPTPAAPAPAPATTDPHRGGPTGDTGGRPTGTPPRSSAAATSGAPVPGSTAGDAPGTPQQRTEQLRGLCRAYLAKKPAQREKALDSPSFAHLVTAAGGRERVEGFCGELVPEAAAKASPDKPGKGPTLTPTPAG